MLSKIGAVQQKMPITLDEINKSIRVLKGELDIALKAWPFENDPVTKIFNTTKNNLNRLLTSGPGRRDTKTWAQLGLAMILSQFNTAMGENQGNEESRLFKKNLDDLVTRLSR